MTFKFCTNCTESVYLYQFYRAINFPSRHELAHSHSPFGCTWKSTNRLHRRWPTTTFTVPTAIPMLTKWIIPMYFAPYHRLKTPVKLSGLPFAREREIACANGGPRATSFKQESANTAFNVGLTQQEWYEDRCESCDRRKLAPKRRSWKHASFVVFSTFNNAQPISFLSF